MSEAKETRGDPRRNDAGCELWRGPRSVLWPVTLDPHADAPPEAYAQAASEGFDGVAWDLRGSTVASAEALSTVRKPPHGVPASACAVAWRCQSTHLETAVAELTAVIEESARLGADCLCVTLPPIACTAGPAGEVHPSDEFHGYQQHLNFAAALLHELRLRAAGSGVALAMEPAAGGGLLSPVELRELIDGAYSGSVGACLDVARVSKIGAPPDWIETLRHRIVAVRLPHDTTPGLELDAVLVALTRTRYDGTIICPCAAWVDRCREAMRGA